MYGLINKAIQNYVETNHGVEVWNTIKGKAGINLDNFSTMKAYPDELTYGIVQSSCEVLNLEGGDFLEKIGYYWMSYTAVEGYGDLLNAGGNSLPEFLNNLNLMHFRLGTVMPDMVMPTFTTKIIDENTLELHYKSHRAGLAPMVVGIIKALGDRFKTPCRLELIQSKSTGHGHDVFIVSW